MRVAKASTQDIVSLTDFLQACEESLERAKYSLTSAYDKWEEWDEDDEDKRHLLRIRDKIAKSEDIEPNEVDNRIILYEWLREKFVAAAGWRRVTIGVDVLIENCCDETKSHLDFHPSIQIKHVANEQ